jgi:A/G-specific adenine glycosylase
VNPASAELLDWYRAQSRDLPWRRTRDPYRILVSEVMCQQTQVERVRGYYERFLAAFPDERALAAAPLEAVHRLWKGLGYPNRATRLQAACAAVVARGAWPDTPQGLEELPGIGPYTAGAVACFAFARPVPLVDTNIARVYARRDGLRLPLDRRELWTHAAAQVEPDDPIAWNNAVMELGALVCTARNPDCPHCPWATRCAARNGAERHRATAAPLKAASVQITYGEALDRRLPRVRVVLGLIHHEGRYLVARRPLGVAQGGRWELPGGKREAGEDDRRAVARELAEELGAEVLAARQLLIWHHRYDERQFTFVAFRVTLFNPQAVRPLVSQELAWVTPSELITLDFPPANAALIQRLRAYHRLG